MDTVQIHRGSCGTGRVAERRSQLSQGTVVAGFRIGEVLGQGGMATVYEATIAASGRAIALKVMRRTASRDPTALERFRREAEAVHRLADPHIVGVIEHGMLPDGRPYAVMERLHGETLKQRLPRGRLRLDEVAAVIVPIARALQTAHAHRIVHRDLKPENVFLAGDGRVMLLDFGIAQLDRFFDAPSRLTEPGFVVGTPLYIAPEQAQGHELGSATDVYGLGVVLFEMLTGRLPFLGKTPVAVLSEHLMDAPPSVSELAQVPAALAALVARMLAKTPADRPTLDEVCATCEQAARPRVPRRRLLLVFATTVLVAILAGWSLSLQFPELSAAVHARVLSFLPG